MLLCALLHTVWTEKRECCRMCYDTAAQTKIDDTADCRQNKIAEAITYKRNQYNK